MQQSATLWDTDSLTVREREPGDRLQLFDFVEQFARCRERVGIDVRPADHTFGVDNEDRPPGVAAFFVEHVVGLRHLAVRPEVARHRELNSIALIVLVGHARCPGPLDSHGIATDLDDFGVDGLESLIICAEPAHLVRSPACEAGRVEPDHHDLPP